MRILIFSDIHGAYKGLLQALERAKFDPAEDRLVCVGDIVDGWPESKECVDFLIQHKAFCLMGNHDRWFLDFILTGKLNYNWYSLGGAATLESYEQGVPKEHEKFFQMLYPYWVDSKDRVFVHGGWDTETIKRIEKVTGNLSDLWWNREMWYKAETLGSKDESSRLTDHSEIFIGHTFCGFKPLKYCEVWNLDTGAGWDGVVTVMDVDTKEYWQSDKIPRLYPNIRGRF